MPRRHDAPTTNAPPRRRRPSRVLSFAGVAFAAVAVAGFTVVVNDGKPVGGPRFRSVEQPHVVTLP